MEEEIRAQLEKELGEAFADEIWRMFTGSKSFEEYRERRLGWQDLKELAEEYQADAREFERRVQLKAAPQDKDLSDASKEPRGSESLRASSGGVSFEPPELKAEEYLRGEVFEECLAEIAANDPGVRRFRQEVLDGKPLEPEQALKLVRSPAAQAWPLSWFQAYRIPVLDHRAELKKCEPNVPEDKLRRHRATIYIDPPVKPSGCGLLLRRKSVPLCFTSSTKTISRTVSLCGATRC